MKKLFAFSVMAILFLPCISSSNDSQPSNQTSTILFFSAVKTNGTGYALPTKMHFIMPSAGRWVIWSYENGTTTARYLTNPHTIEGKQIGIAYVIFGGWSAPTLLNQPGKIEANMLVLIGFVMPMQ
ncbi:MAG: hypothetical protein J7J36_06130 [Thermoplasmata archaeon]|nr:hypothetical protein [Thermoplasmata archaeon]